jgi:hemerythrin-like domain-containing protein
MTSTDAITVLKEDHRAVEQLFKRFEHAGSRAHVEKRQIVDRVIEMLSVHAAIEEQLFYPVARATVPGSERIALESIEEHHVVKWLLSELESMAPEDERFDAKMTVLIENVRHHVEEEEHDFFPLVRSEIDRGSLNDLGETMVEAKKVAPTHPHPRSPDMPPLNLLVGTTAGVVDRIGDTVNGVAQGYVSAVRDLVATLLGRKKPQQSPTGSKLARTTATRVRSGAADATQTAIDAILTAKDSGERAARRVEDTGATAKSGTRRTASSARRGATNTARAASAGAKGTATSSRRSSQRAVTTAKRAATTTARQARAATRSTASTAKRSVSETASVASQPTR